MESLNGRKHRLATGILKPVNTTAIVIIGFYTFLWGLWAISPWWSVFDQAYVYHWMIDLAPEPVWGVISLLVGIFMIYGVFVHSYISLAVGSLVGYFHWLIISIMLFVGNWRDVDGLTSFVVSMYCAFIWLNITKNRRTLFP